MNSSILDFSHSSQFTLQFSDHSHWFSCHSPISTIVTFLLLELTNILGYLSFNLISPTKYLSKIEFCSWFQFSSWNSSWTILLVPHSWGFPLLRFIWTLLYSLRFLQDSYLDIRMSFNKHISYVPNLYFLFSKRVMLKLLISFIFIPPSSILLHIIFHFTHVIFCPSCPILIEKLFVSWQFLSLLSPTYYKYVYIRERMTYFITK